MIYISTLLVIYWRNHLKDMTYVLLIINAVVIALIALYVYVHENESRIGNNSAKLDITGNVKQFQDKQ